jgi:hypothetical protein
MEREKLIYLGSISMFNVDSAAKPQTPKIEGIKSPSPPH